LRCFDSLRLNQHSLYLLDLFTRAIEGDEEALSHLDDLGVRDKVDTLLKARFNRKELSEKTISDYLIWLNVLNRKFGTRILCDISAQEIEVYRDNIAYYEPTDIQSRSSWLSTMN
jgi:hypothetical protein